MMSDVAGVLGIIKISKSAKLAFYKAHGKDLLSDYICQKKVRELVVKHELEVKQKQLSDAPLSWLEFMNAEHLHREAIQQFSCDAGDFMMINYDDETSSLFYLHFFNREWAYCLETSISLQTLLNAIVEYKDIDSEDYICFSSSPANFLTDPLYCFWKIIKGNLQQIMESDIGVIPEKIVSNINDAANNYYFNILDRNMQAVEESCYQDFNEQTMLKEMVVIENDLIKFAL
jgi:hypothetical protein